MHYFLTLFW